MKPRQPAPPLRVPTVDDGAWDLALQEPERWTLIAFYRGLHCPICRRWLRELDRRRDELAARGVTSVLAVSGDTPARARQAKEDWRIGSLVIGHSLSLEQMRAWGLFVSEAIADNQMPIFSEPGVVLVDADGALYYVALTSMPFGRPRWDDVVEQLDYAIENNAPARGNV